MNHEGVWDPTSRLRAEWLRLGKGALAHAPTLETSGLTLPLRGADGAVDATLVDTDSLRKGGLGLGLGDCL